MYLRVRVFSSRASPLRRVVGRRRDTSRRKTETLKPFPGRSGDDFFPTRSLTYARLSSLSLQSRNERLYNKMRKSEITTRMKKVFLKATALGAQEACSEEEIGDLEKLISEATKAVDKAIAKGVLHKNTGARRKSRMSKYKQDLRRSKGLLTA